MEIDWPPRWQADAKEALLPYIGTDTRVEILVGDPATCFDGTVMAGFVYLDGAVPQIIYDRSGRADVYPWRLLLGPVLRIYRLEPRRKRKVLYAHPAWTPRLGD